MREARDRGVRRRRRGCGVRRSLHAAPAPDVRIPRPGVRGRGRHRRDVVLEPLSGSSLRRGERRLLLLVLRGDGAGVDLDRAVREPARDPRVPQLRGLPLRRHRRTPRGRGSRRDRGRDRDRGCAGALHGRAAHLGGQPLPQRRFGRDRVLQPRVRHPRIAADLLGRPGRAGRRPPEERLRPRRGAGGRGPAVPPRLLPAVLDADGWQHETTTTSIPTACRFARRGPGGEPVGDRHPPRRHDDPRGPVGRAGRPYAASCSSTPATGPSRCFPARIASTAGTSACASSRSCCWAWAALGRCAPWASPRGSTTSTRATRPSPSWNAHRVRRNEAGLPSGGGRRVAARYRVHHPHAGGSRPRPLPRGPAGGTCARWRSASASTTAMLSAWAG